MHVERENTSELLLCVYPAVKVREICEQITAVNWSIISIKKIHKKIKTVHHWESNPCPHICTYNEEGRTKK